MRSNLVFGAMGNVPNRYLLTRLASKAIRGLHKPGVRIEDSINDVLVHCSRANPIASNQSLHEPLAVPLGRTVSLTDLPRKSKVIAFASAREISNPLWGKPRALRA
jgi:hypothetical protein